MPDATLGQSVVTDDRLGYGVPVPCSVRDRKVNSNTASVAQRSGAFVIDAERYWFQAVQRHGEDGLYRATPTFEIVHPNATAMEETFGYAALDAMRGLASGIGRASCINETRLPIEKLADQSIASNDATLVNDTELFGHFRAYQQVKGRFVLRVSAPLAGDNKLGMFVPAGAGDGRDANSLVKDWWGIACGRDVAAAGISGDVKNFVPTLVSDAVSVGGTGNRQVVIIEFNVTLGAQDGPADLRWCQGASNATASVVKSGSYMEARVVG